MTAYFIQAFIYLCAAVIAVPLAKRLGLGSVLGYLMAGVIIGPVVGLVGEETSTLQHFAEFGVVMMLFLVGLELDPQALWNMRRRLFGLGGLQLILTTAAFMLIGILFELDWRTALAIGLILALSSTAIVLQTLNEKGLQKTEGGMASFSVLLFQDIAFIPMLALIPLLEQPGLTTTANAGASMVEESHAYLDLVSGLPNSIHAIVVLAAIAIVIFGGHYLSHPLFKFVAMSRLREVFTAATLMLVIGIAALMSLVGLSPALGTFLAGVVLANSEFRHELESNIEPFKGLLLGLFFITVGAGINFEVLASSWLLVGLLALLIIAVKAAIVYSLVRSFGVCFGGDRWLVSLGLAQAGEFGFVLLSFSMQNHVISGDNGELLALIIAISMFLTPVLFIFFDKVLAPRFEKVSQLRTEDEINEQGKVIIAGIGRFGQIVNRLLVANDIQTVVLDHDAKQVDNLRRLKIKAYFGDATRPDLLDTAGIAEAEMLVIAIDDRIRALELVKQMKSRHPGVKLLVRAFDQIDYYRLKQAGAEYIIKETYVSALDMGCEALIRLGFDARHAEESRRTFVDIENRNSDEMFETWQSSEGTRLSPGYRELFMQQEAALRKAMPPKNKQGDKSTETGQDN